MNIDPDDASWEAFLADAEAKAMELNEASVMRAAWAVKKKPTPPPPKDPHRARTLKKYHDVEYVKKMAKRGRKMKLRRIRPSRAKITP